MDDISVLFDLLNERTRQTYESAGLSRREGIYMFMNQFFEPVYIGRSYDLAGRLNNHRVMLEPQMPDARFLVAKTTDESYETEEILIQYHRPKYNGRGLTARGGFGKQLETAKQN